MKSSLLTFLLAAPVLAAAPVPTFNRDVLPILQSHCQSCHRPGEIGPMPLLSYQDARPWAAAIKEAVQTGRMPPWHSDTPSQKFHNDPSLTAEEKATITNWAAEGAPEGNPKDARPNPSFTTGWNIGEPDLIVKPAKPFDVPPAGAVEYTYYILPAVFEHDTWIAASEFRPGNRAVMHHGQVFVRTPESKWLRGYPVGEYFVPREQLAKPSAEHPSRTTNAGAGAMEQGIAPYVPGYVPAPLPGGILVPAGSDLVFQLHYTPNGKAATDLPLVGLRLAKTPPEKQAVTLVAANDTFVIPPGAADFPVHGKKIVGADCDLEDMLPHMHLRGKSMLFKATYPDGTSEVLLNVPNYDFSWQQQYVLAAPKHLPAGTVLEVFAKFDNSPNNKWNPAPGEEVRWGDQSWSEMMVGFFDVSIPSSMDRKLLNPPPAPAAQQAGTAAAQPTAEKLFQAIRNNDLAGLGGMLSRDNVNTRDSRGSTLLMYAAAYGSSGALKLLLERGADVNARNQFDATALVWGANDPAKASLLIGKGADVNARTKAGRTPLMVASTCYNCLETIRLLIAKGADVNAKDANGVNALHEAAFANDDEVIRFLLDKGANAGSADGMGMTPLMISAYNCNAGAMRALLAKGADVNAANTFSGEVKFGKIQIIHLTPLMFAAPYCGAELMNTLLRAGARVNEKESRNMTPLMLAVASEHQDPEVTRLLLKAGADANVKSSMGETALDWALKFGGRANVETLKAAGAQNGDPYRAPVIKTAVSRTPAQAVETAVGLMQRSTAEFFHQSGCVGCHHQAITLMAVSAAKASGLAGGGEKDLVTAIEALEGSGEEQKLERVRIGGFTDTQAYALFGLGMAKVAPNAGIDAAVALIAGAQHRDGTWRNAVASRAPIEEGVIGRSVMTARALQTYGLPARKVEFDGRLARLRDWLMEAQPVTNDDFAMLAVGLKWMGANPARVEQAGRALLARQRQDGGWSQNGNLESDAFATGESLWALREAGILAAQADAYRSGVDFLLKTQAEDGSWYVRSRAVKLQPYFQSGFPYDHDQWISSTATGYAVMALAPAAER
jgi:ankyrin repeat protein